MKPKTKIKKYLYMGCGFPVILTNVPSKLIRGKQEPLINHKDLGKTVTIALCLKKTPLTGNQVKFLRMHFNFSLREFATIFGLTHPAVLKWEGHGDDPALIQPSIEKTIRLDSLFRLGLNPTKFYQAFSEMKDLAHTLQNSEKKKELPLKLA